MKRGKIFKIDFNYCDGDGSLHTYELNKRGPTRLNCCHADESQGPVTEILNFSEANYTEFVVFFQDGSSVDVYKPNQVFYAPPEVKNGKD